MRAQGRVPAAGAVPARLRGQAQPASDRLFRQSFRARPTASRLRGRRGGGLFSAFRRGAQRSAPQRSARDSDPARPPARPPSRLLVCPPPGGEVFLDLPCLFCLPEDVNNAQRGLSSLRLERSAPTRAPLSGWISRSNALSGRGHGCAVDTGWCVGRDPHRPPRDPRLVFFFALNTCPGCYVGQRLSGSSSSAETR